jgi:hypothetical protein
MNPRTDVLNSVRVGFHIQGTGEAGEDCGKPVTWYDSPELSWLQCECGASSVDGTIISYGAPVVPAPTPPLADVVR